MTGRRALQSSGWRHRLRALLAGGLFAAALGAPPAGTTGVFHPVPARAAEPIPARPEIATYVGEPAARSALDQAQQPFGIAVSGRYTYIADPANRVVRLLLKSASTKPSAFPPPDERVFAGNGGLSVEGDGSDPTAAQLSGPYAVAAGAVNRVGDQVTGFDVYIADTYGNQVRKVTVTVPVIDSATTSLRAVITTIAGIGSSFGFDGDGPALAHKLNSPYALAWDSGTWSLKLQPPRLPRQVLYIADSLNGRVRALDLASDTLTTVAQGLGEPRGLAVTPGGLLYIADTANGAIRSFDPVSSKVSTPLQAGKLQQPTGLALDAQGRLLIADTGDNLVRSARFSAGHLADLTTVAGTGVAGALGDGGPAVAAQLSSPFGVAVRDDGDVLIADTGNNLVRLVDGATGIITRIAGNRTPSFSGDGGPPTEAQLGGPSAVVSQPVSGPLTQAAIPQTRGVRYVVDTLNQAVRTFATAGTVSTLAGTGGVPGAPLPAPPRGELLKDSHLAYPMGAALSPDGSRLYVADTFNNRVAMVDLKGNTISTIAGNGVAGFSGDGEAAIRAMLSYPTGVAVDSAGDLYIADAYNARIRRVHFSSTGSTSGVITTVAGSGVLGYTGDGGPATKADLYFPLGIAVSGSPPILIIADSFNHRIRRVDGAGVITTLAGDGTPAFKDGPATAAELDRPWGAAVQGSSVYIADYINQRVRLLDGGGAMSTLSGQPSRGLKGELGKADRAETDGPRAVDPLGSTGAVLVADSMNARIRWVGVTLGGVQSSALNFGPQNLATASGAQTVTVTSTGTGLLVLGPVGLNSVTSDFTVDGVQDRCSNQRLEPGVPCTFQVQFTPRTPGLRQGTVLIPGNAGDSPSAVALSGKATAPVVQFSPPNLAFHQAPGGSAAPQTLTLRNGGDGILTVDGIAVHDTQERVSTDFFQSNDCPRALPAAGTCQITVTMPHIANGTRSALLEVSDSAPGSPHRVPLFGNVVSPAVRLQPSGLFFSQNLGSSSPAQVVQVTNTGDGPLQLTGIRDSGDFLQSNNCPAVLASGASCLISVTFTPAVHGEESSYILLADNALDSPQRVSLLGFGTLPQASLQPGRLVYRENIGVLSGVQSVSLGNGGDGPLRIFSIRTSGDFSQSNTCPAILSPGQGCRIDIRFRAGGPGARNGALTVSDDAGGMAGASQVVSLAGTGVAPVAQLAPSILAPSANLGQSAPPQTVVLTNAGDGILTVSGVRLAGGAAGEYSIPGNGCRGQVAPGGNCFITVAFHPAGLGLRQAFLQVFDNAGGSPQQVSLRGTGTGPAARLSRTSIDFGTVALGRVSPPQTVTLTNSGTGVMRITAVSTIGDFHAGGCAGSLNAGWSCVVSVTFIPSAPGTRSGVLLIYDTASDSPQRVTLTGN